VKIAIGGYARRRLTDDIAFAGVREIRAVGTQSESNAPAEVRFEAATVTCQAGGARKSGSRCMRCKRFERLVERSGELSVQCRWTHEDRVGAIMSLVPALVTAPSTTRVRRARVLLGEGGPSHLLVVDRYRLSGVLARTDLVGRATRGETIAHRFTPSPWVIDADATLGQAAALMRQRQISSLPVVSGGYVQGLVTEATLFELGAVPPALDE